MRNMIHALLLIAAPAYATGDSPLRMFDFLAGHCWQGRFANGAVDTRCLSWVYGGQHLRDVHVVRGEGDDYCGETIYSVDGESGEVIFRYWNSLGGVSDGEMTFDGNVLVSADETYVGDDGRERVFRSSLKPLDERRYEAVTEERVGDGWREVSRVMFKRAEVAAASLNGACSG